MDSIPRWIGVIVVLAACSLDSKEASEGFEEALRPPDGSHLTPARIAFGADAEVVGKASFLFPSAKTIELEWYAGEDSGWSRRSERTRLWPTEVSSAGFGRLAVAGRDARNGHTVIELWTFAPLTPDAGDEASASLVRVSIRSKEAVFDERTVGKRLVRTMFPVHADPDRSLVRFEDSRDLYVLDLQARTTTLVLSATPRDDVPHEPALARDYEDRWSGRHDVHGDVYFLVARQGAEHDTLALFDRDRDGAIDEHGALTIERFHAMGLGDGAAYARDR